MIQVEITEEWLQMVSDEQGLTRGQVQLLDIHAGKPYIGKVLSPFVAHHISKCTGYRGLTAEERQRLAAFKGR